MGGVREEILDLLRCGEFEDAIERINRGESSIGPEDIDIVLSHFRNTLAGLDPGDGAAIRRLRLRIERLSAYRDGGFEPDSLIFPVVMPDGYRGKILLVSFFGGVISKKVCLRSNDLRHIDILRNARMEAADLGLRGTGVHELGGARIEAEEDGSFRIWGGSGDFGSCDREIAAELLRAFRPGIRVKAED